MKDKCEAFRALIPQYASGELDAKTASKLQRHISKCPDCSALLDAQLESMDGSGRLYILGITSEGAQKCASRRTRISIMVVAILCVIFAAVAIWIQTTGVVRIGSVDTEDMTLEQVQQKRPDLYISESDVAIAETVANYYNNNAIDPSAMSFDPGITNRQLKKMGSEGKNLSCSIVRGTDHNSIIIFYYTAFYRYFLSLPVGSEPTVENLGKHISLRYDNIFGFFRENRYWNGGNTFFEKQIITLDIWGTLTRQELVKYGSGWEKNMQP